MQNQTERSGTSDLLLVSSAYPVNGTWRESLWNSWLANTETRVRQLEAQKQRLSQPLREQDRKDRIRHLIQIGVIMSRLGIENHRSYGIDGLVSPRSVTMLPVGL